jgi:glycosyltransferase involved in cell wall biosynthesis
MRCIIYMNAPAPYRNPIIDQFVRREPESVVVYRRAQLGSRGWGDAEPDHPYIALSDLGLVQKIRFLLGHVMGGWSVVVLYGWTGYWPKVLAAAARISRRQIVVRTDSNSLIEWRKSYGLRTLRRCLLKVLLGRQAAIWISGTRNRQFWSYYGFDRQYLLPLAVPQPPMGSPSAGRRLRDELGIGHDKFVFLFVGRVVRHKGVLDLLEAFRELRGAIAGSAVLLIVGPEGDIRLDRTQLPRGVVYLGPMEQAHLGRAYAAAQVLILPSRSEPWGLVVNEAIANGCRVIASTDVGATLDLINDDTGRVFNAGRVDDLIAAMDAEQNESRSVFICRSMMPFFLSADTYAEAMVEYLADLSGATRQNMGMSSDTCD